MSKGQLNTRTDSYDGCLGLLQRNLADVAFYPVAFPFHHHGMSQAFTLYQSDVMIVSLYNCSVEKSQEDSYIPDIMQNVHSFSTDLWLLVLFAAVVFISMILFHYRNHHDQRHGSRSYSIWTVVAFFLEHGSMREINRVSSFISFLLISFIFLIWTSWKNLMSTDLTSVKQPFVAESYEDISQMDRKPMWFSNYGIHEFFENSGPDSAGGRLWKKALTVGLSKCLHSFSGGVDLRILADALDLKTFSLFPGSVTTIARLVICKWVPPGICSYSSTDPKESFSSFYGLVARDDFTKTEEHRKLSKLIARFMESDVLYRLTMHGFGEMLKLIEKDPTVFSMSAFQDCMSDSIVTHAPHHDSLRISNIMNVFKICLLLFSIATIVLFTERTQKVIKEHFRKKMNRDSTGFSNGRRNDLKSIKKNNMTRRWPSRNPSSTPIKA